jgi:alanine racemase
MPVSTWVEVDLDRFAANLGAVRALLRPEQQILLVVKADAYGHGAVEIAEAAEPEGVALLGVATLHEGIQLRRAGCRLPIVALSPLLPAEIGEAVAHDLSPTVCDADFARALSAAAVRTGRAIRCHVEIDTGMGRTGVCEGEAEEFLVRLAGLPGLRLASIFTHFPDADAEDPTFSIEQLRRLRALLERLAGCGVRPPRVHAANSAGMLNVPGALLDWVRLGLVAYGHPPPLARTPIRLQPVMTLKSRIVQVRDLPAGSPVSYGRTFVTQRPSRIGVVAIGYGHGLSWLLSNRGHMLVGGTRVPIVGRVTMDLTMVDLTGAPGVRVGDEVVLFGEQGNAVLPLEEVARGSETVPYEVMCTIGKRVTRIFVRGGRPVKLTSLVGESAEWVQRAADHFRLRAQAVAAARQG